MLICTICVCQNQQNNIIPVTNSFNENINNSTITGASDPLHSNTLSLYDIWQFLNENTSISHHLEVALHNRKLALENKNEDRRYNALLSDYREKLGKVFYFNQNNYPSDTVGDLKGNVFYAQNSIIPAVNRIDGDIHPHLVPDRKTLIIFKPHETIKQNENIEVKVYNDKKEEIYSTHLLSPSQLPSIAGKKYSFTHLTPSDFNIPEASDLYINSSDMLEKVMTDKSYFNQIISENNIIQLDIGNSTSNINLNALKNHVNKKIIFKLDDNAKLNIKYKNKSISREHQQSFVMVSDASGNWYSRDEARLNQHLKQALHQHKNQIPDSFDTEFSTNADINKISNDTKLFHQIISENDAIKIATKNCHWAKDFIIPNGRQYANKKILFTSKAHYNSDVVYGDKKVSIVTNDSLLFVSDQNGIWSIAKTQSNTQENSYYDIPNSFTLKINTNKELLTLSRDIDYFNKIIENNDTIHIATRNANWARHFTLENNVKFKNKKIYFSSEADYSSHVFYGDKKLTIKTNENQLFVCDENGFWRTSKDEPLINELTEEIKYIENGWSISLPKHIIKPGIELEFNYKNQKGTLSDIKVGAASELLLHTIDIGMLTPNKNQFAFQTDPELQRQYYQQIPVNRMIVSSYAPVYLKEIVFPNGQYLIERSTDEGGGHKGDMREIIGKGLISDGINLANYGVNSSSLEENRFLPTSQITLHHSRGRYKNGLQVHGWSGGAGKATLSKSVDNEFSHELGHNYHISHYFKGFHGGVHATADKPNSTWGWDADNNFFIPNFEKAQRNQTTYLKEKKEGEMAAEPFMQHSMAKDAMSGGEIYDVDYNAYTLHTPASSEAIQQYFENNAVFSKESSTGYKKWNSDTQTMEDFLLPHSLKNIFIEAKIQNGHDVTETQLIDLLNVNDHIKINSYNAHYPPNVYIPKADVTNINKVIEIDCTSQLSIALHVNDQVETIKENTKIYYISNGNTWETHSEYTYSKTPYKQGVPVVTLVGFYDTNNQLKSYIYPALEGSYGMVYDTHTINKTKPYIAVTLADGTKKKYQLDEKQTNKDLMNKFHINIERDLNPIKAELFIDDQLISSRDIALSNLSLNTMVNGIIQ
ncbi:M66 family metalloprotease [Providencia stuartii]|uniref:M66 family metalloprotease n=1 Tax=Providencia stuartii TaxID=588 RepID=UPI0023E30860|nr:M66 family metalloprotease [Providencia stuartii]ELR5143553.1 hypothetical protein [Providencia stuartii]WER20691.1 M66 family metalloprotease [Providencia stuartii]WER24809.1 M66 family metalloprotease [Providencia stuartii]WER28900.1 M66 family metalloprotease [Providencia stuartii]